MCGLITLFANAKPLPEAGNYLGSECDLLPEAGNNYLGSECDHLPEADESHDNLARDVLMGALSYL